MPVLMAYQQWNTVIGDWPHLVLYFRLFVKHVQRCNFVLPASPGNRAVPDEYIKPAVCNYDGRVQATTSHVH